MPKYEPRIGKDFEVQERKDNAAPLLYREKTIAWIFLSVTLTGLIFLVGAAVYGVYMNDWSKVDTVYGKSLPIFTLICGYLFGKRGSSD